MNSRAFLPVVSVFTAVFALLASSVLHAQQYRWIDKDGRVQYSDAPPPASAKDVRRTSPGSTGSGTAGTGAPGSFELAKAVKDFPVTIYTSPNCKEGCDLMRAALNKRGVPFAEKQVYDQETNDELKRVAGALEVPTLVVGSAVRRGFEQESVDALLDTGGYPRTGVLKPLAQKAPPPPDGSAPAADTTVKPAAEAEPATQKAGKYDPSGLVGPAPKQGRYGIPGETK